MSEKDIQPWFGNDQVYEGKLLCRGGISFRILNKRLRERTL